MNTVDKQEIQNFSKDSAHWWDENGPFKPLHHLNPVRLSYIKKQICDHYGRDVNAFDSYKDLEILDIGCGGGLVCEPMARLEGNVTGIDADENAIHVAKAHAKEFGLNIDYHCTSSDALINTGKQYNVVLALEIIEHVADRDVFVKSVLSLCKPGGLVIFSTLNRTAKSYALGIVAVEYILRWVPMGTHDWKKFVKPAELARHIRKTGATVSDICGLVYNPLKNDYALKSHDTDVNYFMAIKKHA
ncbi:MAG: bifunctional 2-polyprenyl-6-hydroxyphenol methylase/3-demethylubiquinol 3-O-methyltransferase UbiG [Alphaproteobacteria bacterium]|nr:bifunctional 2-polyprenyl-6-hydroxyphenol methylase/3-demethylubiquinol 3-O-methyltransferase UbiG [Alphaproteobacteria bacterium]